MLHLGDAALLQGDGQGALHDVQVVRVVLVVVKEPVELIVLVVVVVVCLEGGGERPHVGRGSVGVGPVDGGVHHELIERGAHGAVEGRYGGRFDVVLHGSAVDLLLIPVQYMVQAHLTFFLNRNILYKLCLKVHFKNIFFNSGQH